MQPKAVIYPEYIYELTSYLTPIIRILYVHIRRVRSISAERLLSFQKGYTDFHEIWYRSFSIGGQSELVLFNFLHRILWVTI
jgi:hypothetical protein